MPLPHQGLAKPFTSTIPMKATVTIVTQQHAARISRVITHLAHFSSRANSACCRQRPASAKRHLHLAARAEPVTSSQHLEQKQGQTVMVVPTLAAITQQLQLIVTLEEVAPLAALARTPCQPGSPPAAPSPTPPSGRRHPEQRHQHRAALRQPRHATEPHRDQPGTCQPPTGPPGGCQPSHAWLPHEQGLQALHRRPTLNGAHLSVPNLSRDGPPQAILQVC
jgi:hypothetical protein